MDGTKSREALAQFLDYLADKGLMAKATAQARKAAASSVLGILDENEAKDVTVLDLDSVISRFGNLHGKRYTPQSLSTYKSRVKSALEDFSSYLGNPLAFRPGVQPRERSKSKPSKESTRASNASAGEARPEAPRPPPTPMASSNIVPIPLRADLVVYIQGLPFDLSLSEAKKIGAVVAAMAHVE